MRYIFHATGRSKSRLDIDQPRRGESLGGEAIRKASPRISEGDCILDCASLARLDLPGQEADERRQHRDSGVEPAWRGIGEREGVDAGASARSDLNDLAAESGKDGGVFAFRVHDQGASAAEHRADQLGFDQEGLAGTTGREDDRVVGLEREPVDDHRAAGRGVDAIEQP